MYKMKRGISKEKKGIKRGKGCGTAKGDMYKDQGRQVEKVMKQQRSPFEADREWREKERMRVG